MRRRGIFLLGILIFVGALIAAWTFAYRAGESDGRSAVTAARSAFATRIAGVPASAASTGGSGSPTGNRGQGGNATGGTGQGSAASGSPRGGSTAPAGSAVANAGGGRGVAAAGIAGKVTKVDGPVLTLQQTDNMTVSVTTNTPLCASWFRAPSPISRSVMQWWWTAHAPAMR
jgi:hypothetical protein